MSYDRADWHYGGEFPPGLPQENGATHIGMFLAWAIISGLAGELHNTEEPDALERVRARVMTGREFFLKYCDEKFTNEDLNDEGNAFASVYYGDGNKWPYMEDYGKVFKGYPSLYHVEDSWENYDRIAPLISRRFIAWRNGSSRPWWKFWA